MPFAGYEDFEECVADNQDKDEPEAFCAWLHYQTTGEWPAESRSEKGEQTVKELLEQVRSALKDAVGTNIELVWAFDDALIVKDADGEYHELGYTEQGEEINFEEPQPVEAGHVQKRLLGENTSFSVKTLYELLDKKDLEECRQALKGRDDVENPDALYSWLHYQVKGDFPGYRLNGVAEKSTELTGPIAWKDDEKQIAFAPVLIPGEEDLDGEVVTEKQSEDAAHEWMMHYRNVDVDHSMNNVGEPAESWVMKEDREYTAVHTGERMHLPRGTWMMGSWFPDRIWQGVKSGDYNGFSIMAVRRKALKNATGAEKQDMAMKKVLLRDLGPDWVPAFVSAVENPAVPKSKWVALKSRDDGDSGDGTAAKGKGFLGKLRELLIGDAAEKEGRTLSEENLETLESALESLAAARAELNRLIVRAGEREGYREPFTIQMSEGGDTMNKEQVENLLGAFKKDLKENHIDPVREDIDSLKELLEANADGQDQDQDAEGSAEKGAADGDADTGDGDSADADTDNDSPEMEAVKSEVGELKSQVEKQGATLEALAEKLGVSTESKSIKGQDGDDPEGAEKQALDFGGRDSFGRKIDK